MLGIKKYTKIGKRPTKNTHHRQYPVYVSSHLYANGHQLATVKAPEPVHPKPVLLPVSHLLRNLHRIPSSESWIFRESFFLVVLLLCIVLRWINWSKRRLMVIFLRKIHNYITVQSTSHVPLSVAYIVNLNIWLVKKSWDKEIK